MGVLNTFTVLYKVCELQTECRDWGRDPPSGHKCMCAFSLCLCCPVQIEVLLWTDPLSKESHHLSNCPTNWLTDWLTHSLTPWSRVLPANLPVPLLVKKFPSFFGTWSFITAFTSIPYSSVSWAETIQSTPPYPTSWRSFLILSFHLHLGLAHGFFPSGFPPKSCIHLSCPPCMSHALHMLFFLIWPPK